MWRKIVAGVIGGIIGVFPGLIIGWITGANIGGNYFTDFTFNGVRGYEATGQIGSIIGAVLFASAGVAVALLIVHLLARRKSRLHQEV